MLDSPRQRAVSIWQAGLRAVLSDHLVQQHVRVADRRLHIADRDWPLADIDRIVVVGFGKAGGGMAEGFENALGAELLQQKNVSGWVNVPADCVRPLKAIHLHPGRPAAVNEPTAEGVWGTEKILQLVGSLTSRDLCVCLISGGGSALAPAPAGISLEDKQALTRSLSAAGANIQELNTVRKQLSRIKGGGLARACRAGRLVSLIISDVLGDPLDIIASGPTTPDSAGPQDAAEVLRKFDLLDAPAGQRAAAYWRETKEAPPAAACEVSQTIIGNNATAVAAAEREAVRLGYATVSSSASGPEGLAEPIGRDLAEWVSQAVGRGERRCRISGGEPVVKLAPEEIRGKGGRNQQLVLAALDHRADWRGAALLSGGLDGEDGPTDAAGAILDEEVEKNAARFGLSPSDFLRRNDAYAFFQQTDGLLQTGPTDTNVCDLRVAVSGS